MAEQGAEGGDADEVETTLLLAATLSDVVAMLPRASDGANEEHGRTRA